MRFLVLTTGRRGVLAKVLRESLLALHPEAQVELLLCDARLTDPIGSADCLPQTVSFDGFRWADLVMAFGERRAGWAATAWILIDNPAPMVLIDDAFEAFGRLDPLVAHGDRLAARALHVDSALGAWGGFAPGLVVVPPRFGRSDWGRWWRQRVVAALGDPAAEADPDPWWDLPSSAARIEDPAFCLSTRTAGDIDVGEGPEAPYLVDFAGLDPNRPWWFAPDGTTPEVFLSEAPGLRRLCQARAGRLLRAGWRPEAEREEKVLPGIALTAEMRAWYRGLLAQGPEAGLPPNPFVADEVRDFLDLLGGPGDRDGSGAGRHVDLVMSRREDLRNAFPHARWRDRRNFRRWLWSNGLREGETSLITLPDPPRPAGAVEVRNGRLPFGVNLVGYLDADLGLGVVARRLQRALDAVGVPHVGVSYDRTSSNLRPGVSGEMHAPYHFTLMLITPEQLPLFVADVGEDFLAGHHNIGLWYWESDVLTPRQSVSFNFVDEVWAATRYLKGTFGAAQRVPVHLIPPPLVFDQPDPAAMDRDRLGLDDRFTFLFSFDYLSVMDRKNPIGLAEAYRRAFPDEHGGTRLVLKSISGHLFPRDRERLLDAVADRADIAVWDRLLPAGERLALIAAADCYVSLHRAEGLGLTMAEAMAVGTPVIATAYSGNLDFMPPGSALLVPAEVVEVGPGQYYPAHGHWAEPDLDEAAAMMRRVHGDAGLRSRLVSAGRAALVPFSYEAAGAAARDSLLEAWNASSTAAAASART